MCELSLYIQSGFTFFNDGVDFATGYESSSSFLSGTTLMDLFVINDLMMIPEEHADTDAGSDLNKVAACVHTYPPTAPGRAGPPPFGTKPFVTTSVFCQDHVRQEMSQTVVYSSHIRNRALVSAPN